MSLGNSPKFKKGSRVGEVFLQPNQFAVAIDMLKQADVMLRIGMCVFAGFLFWLISAGWERPFPYYEGSIPERAIAARVPFSVVNVSETEKAREARGRQVVTLYRHNQGQVNQLRLQLIEEIIQLKAVESFEALQRDQSTAELWDDFLFEIPGTTVTAEVDAASSGSDAPVTATESPAATTPGTTNAIAITPSPGAGDAAPRSDTAPSTDPAVGNPEDTSPSEREQVLARKAQLFSEFQAELAKDEELTEFKKELDAAMAHIDENGLLKNLQHDVDKIGGDLSLIRVINNQGEAAKLVKVDDVRIENSLKQLKLNLSGAMPEPLARHVAAWFSVKDRLKETLRFDETATGVKAEQEAREVPEVLDVYDVGAILAPGSRPLTAETLQKLQYEHDEMARRMTVHHKLSLTLSHYGMYAAIFSLCGFYSIFRRREVLTNKLSLIRVLCLAVITLISCRLSAAEFRETGIIPLLLFSMTIVVAFDQEVALLLSTVMALIVVVSSGYGMIEFLVYVASMATAVLCLRHVRSRTKLIYVGIITAVIATATSIGSCTLMRLDQGLDILESAAWYGFFAIVAGMLMSALLPLIENLFDIQTELSLLELCDVSHPLLQELVRRAPGTYHHTMNVASIAEAGADAIGANGLLVRVGSYYHDIGKMLKPGYFIENQGEGGNRHESLLPAMSTLVIIAHVKDGADLARQHGLPNSLVDFIMQHHGTTLVEYFYRRANEESKAHPDGGEVDEHSYRYPGPKPQTKEAAVLMLADSVESACRTLTDPTPSRIEHVVHELAMKKLLDGQFDECELTLSELKKLEVSLTKSLSAVYHARIKYPDQQSA